MQQLYNCQQKHQHGNAIDTETKSITNDISNNGEVAEAEAELEAEADTNSKKLNSSSNTGIGSSNKSNNDVDNNILKRPDENEEKMIENNVDHTGDNSCETRVTEQQQKCGKSTPIVNLVPGKSQQFSRNDINKTKRRYEERCKSLLAMTERRLELAALALKQKTEENLKLANQSDRNQPETIDKFEIKTQKYYDEYDNKFIVARKAQNVDYVAATPAMMANTWSLINDSNREAEEKTFIDTLRKIKDNCGTGKDIFDAVLILWKTEQSVEKENENDNKEGNYDNDDNNDNNMNDDERKEEPQISQDKIRKDPRKVQQTETPFHELYTIHEELPTKTDGKLREANKNNNKERNYDEDNDDSNMNDDNNKKEREREQCKKERKEEIRKRFRRIRDDDDTYADDTDISDEELFSTRRRIRRTTRNKTTQKSNPRQ